MVVRGDGEGARRACVRLRPGVGVVADGGRVVSEPGGRLVPFGHEAPEGPHGQPHPEFARADVMFHVAATGSMEVPVLIQASSGALDHSTLAERVRPIVERWGICVSVVSDVPAAAIVHCIVAEMDFDEAASQAAAAAWIVKWSAAWEEAGIMSAFVVVDTLDPGTDEFGTPLIAGRQSLHTMRGELTAPSILALQVDNTFRAWRDVEVNLAGEAAAIALVNVDHMLLYNDVHGFMAGDLLLARMNTILQNVAAELGVQCVRVGGNEFAFIVQGLAPRRRAAMIARRACARVADARIRFDDQAVLDAPPFVTLSGGVIATRAGNLEARAKTAVLEAKRLGRARVHVGAASTRTSQPAPKPPS